MLTILIAETADQKEEDLLANDLDEIAKDLCTSMTIEVVDSQVDNMTVSIKLVSPITESLNQFITEGSLATIDNAHAKIKDHIAMLLFAYLADPDNSEEDKNLLFDDVYEITQIL